MPEAELLIRLAQAPMTLREDNRRKLVHLTDAGQQAAAAAQRILTDPPPALGALGADDLAALTRIFATLNSRPEPASLDRQRKATP